VLHVKRPVELLQTAVLHVLVHLTVLINVHIQFHLRVATVGYYLILDTVDILRQQGAFIQVASLLKIHVLVCTRIEFHHHRAIHFCASCIHCSLINVIERHHTCLSVTLN
jgi:hypothetical protein